MSPCLIVIVNIRLTDAIIPLRFLKHLLVQLKSLRNRALQGKKEGADLSGYIRYLNNLKKLIIIVINNNIIIKIIINCEQVNRINNIFRVRYRLCYSLLIIGKKTIYVIEGIIR